MQPVNTAGYRNSKSKAQALSFRSNGQTVSSGLVKDSIVEAERRGNLVIAGLALCLLALSVSLALT